MTWFTGTIVYLLTWWVVLFMVLPWKSNPPRRPTVGHATSAPEKPNLGIKFVVTSVISAFVWAIIYILMKQGIIDFHAIATRMIQEDYR
jgi:predicted secreted protein